MQWSGLQSTPHHVPAKCPKSGAICVVDALLWVARKTGHGILEVSNLPRDCREGWWQAHAARERALGHHQGGFTVT